MAPLRILQVETVNTGFWGVEKHVMRLTAGLLRRGHIVGIAARPDSYMAAEAARLGAEVLPFHIHRRGEWQRLPGAVRFIRRFRPDVVNLHCPVDLGIVSIAAKLLRVPGRFCTRHGAVPFSNPKSAAIHSRVLHSFIAVSEFVRRYMIDEWGVDEEKVTTIYPGLNVLNFPDCSGGPARGPGGPLPADAVVAAVLGRMSEEKGHEVFLRALASAPEVTGVFVGDGPLRPELEQAAASMGLADRLMWAGGHADPLPWIAASDIICVPSVQFEGMPWVVLEGMACGKAMVVTDAGGIPEAVPDRNGIVCPRRDADALANALNTLATDPSRRTQLGGAARRTVEDRFSEARWLDDTERLYRSVW